MICSSVMKTHKLVVKVLFTYRTTYRKSEGRTLWGQVRRFCGRITGEFRGVRLMSPNMRIRHMFWRSGRWNPRRSCMFTLSNDDGRRVRRSAASAGREGNGSRRMSGCRLAQRTVWRCAQIAYIIGVDHEVHHRCSVPLFRIVLIEQRIEVGSLIWVHEIHDSLYDLLLLGRTVGTRRAQNFGDGTCSVGVKYCMCNIVPVHLWTLAEFTGA